jgi:puromycin-sensitive aminopeptidase
VSDNPYRLPRSITPTRYDLLLEPDLTAFTFDGTASIEIEVTEEVSEIVLNAIELTFGSVTLSQGSSSRLARSVAFDEDKQRVALDFGSVITPGRYQLHIPFAGELNDQLHGWYRSTFIDEAGNDRIIATTQMEPSDARRAFPCWDEPNFKAIFGVTLDVDTDLAAFSNSGEKNVTDLGNGKRRIEFEDTMIMSTYLVAFIVGPLEATKPVDLDGIPTRIAYPIGKSHMTQWAEECGVWFLEWLRDYYGIPYPGDKVDHIALPDFAFGAMENLGAITYRETALLSDPATASQLEKSRVADVIAHELAHMWFGDLVTMEWWEGIWLNEAFASFMEFKAVEAKHPEWDRWLTFAADRGAHRFDALLVDSLSSTRPVEFEVISPDDSQEMFDALTYGKGSAVLRMLEQFIGEEPFRNGVAAYLKKHSYGNTVTNDLWDALNAASEYNVGDIMDTWILQGGYPLIRVHRTESGIRLNQSRFLQTPDETDQTLWKVPIHLKYSQNGSVVTEKVLLEDFEMTIDTGSVDWVVVNSGGSGFYRTQYEAELYDALVEQIPSLTNLERLNILDDNAAFAQAGLLPLGRWLKLAEQYVTEKERPIIQVLTAHLATMRAVAGENLKDEANAKIRSVLQPQLARLGWQSTPGESELLGGLRGQVLTALGLSEDQEVIDWALAGIDGVITDPASVEPDLMAATITVAGANANEALFNKLFDAYQAASTAQMSQRFLRSLALTPSHDLTSKVMDMTLNGQIRNQDSSWVAAILLARRSVQQTAWKDIRQRFDEIVAKYPPVTLGRLIDGLQGVYEADLARDIESFFSENPLPQLQKTMQQNQEKMRNNVRFAGRERDRLADILR